MYVKMPLYLAVDTPPAAHTMLLCVFLKQMFKLPVFSFCLVTFSSTLASKTVSTVAIPPYIPTTALRL